MIELHRSFTSPYVRHCRVALADRGIDDRFVEIDYAASAAASPTQRLPFLLGAGQPVTDSSSILRWVREEGGGRFLADLDAFDRDLMVNTALDTTVNLFLLERDGLEPDRVPYLAPQRDRVVSSLEVLERRFDGVDGTEDDGLRLACYLSWAAFRKRIDASPYPTLRRSVAHRDDDPVFADTHPTRGG